MAGAAEEIVVQDANEAALTEFEADFRRSSKQADAGLIKKFNSRFLKLLFPMSLEAC